MGKSSLIGSAVVLGVLLIGPFSAGCSADGFVGPGESVYGDGQGGDGHNNVNSDGDGHNNVNSDGDGHNNVNSDGDGHNNKSEGDGHNN